jgi:ABC-type Fe3+/spermidine/putrescine transport system ATPase subunit
VMHQGRLQQVGTPQEIYEAPKNRFVADFVGVCNFLECRVARREKETVLLSLEDGAFVRAAISAGAAVPAEGTRVVLAVRPEKVVIDAARPERPGTLRARLDNLVYLGTAIHVHMRTSAGTRVIAYRQNDVTLPAGLQPGAEIDLVWDPRSARILLE